MEVNNHTQNCDCNDENNEIIKNVIFLDISNNIINKNKNTIVLDISNNIINKKYTLCFATMCKNEEHCILETLNSIYKFIDYWVVCDTGSTDNTIQIIKTFFKNKNIPGELYEDEWVSFGHNKTLLFERCYKKTDLFIHFDADDLLIGELNINSYNINLQKNIGYMINFKRHDFLYKLPFLFNNNFKWKVCGVAHNTFNCIDNYNKLHIDDLTNESFYILSRDIGNRSNDSEKYLKDAIALKNQFFDTLIIDNDNLNSRSLFYTAQSYFDCKTYKEASEYYRLYTLLKNVWDEEIYQCYLRIVECMIILNTYCIENIIIYSKKCIELFSDRAEIYFIIGNYFFIHNKFELAYFNIKKASEFNIENVKKKYSLFINKKCYGNHLTNLLTNLSFKTNRIQEGIILYNKITNPKDKLYLKNVYPNIIV